MQSCSCHNNEILYLQTAIYSNLSDYVLVAQAGKDATYFGIILIGFGITGR